MNHTQARAIFEEIRARPYRVSEEPGVVANNCYFKGIELLQRLGAHGYAVRGRIGETFWDATLIPPEIVALAPTTHPVTHFYVEAEIDGAWRALDPSFEPALAKHGFRVCEWGSDTPCFEITRLYGLPETVAYQAMWQDADYIADYFAYNGVFLKTLNRWFAAL